MHPFHGGQSNKGRRQAERESSLPPSEWVPVALEPEADTEATSVVIDPSVVEKEIALAVEVFTEPPTVTDPHGEHVDRVAVAVRCKVDGPLEVIPVCVVSIVVDAVRDFEAVVAVRATVVAKKMIPPVCTTVVPVETLVMVVLALMSVVDLVPVVAAVIRPGGRSQGQSEQERRGGKGDLGDAFHGDVSFDTGLYCQNRANISR